MKFLRVSVEILNENSLAIILPFIDFGERGNVTSQILVEGFISEIRNSVIEFNFTDEIDLNDICSSDIFKSLSALISIKSNHAEEDEDEVMWSV